MLHRDAFSSERIHSWRHMDGHRHRRGAIAGDSAERILGPVCTRKAPLAVLHMSRLDGQLPVTWKLSMSPAFERRLALCIYQ